MDKTYTKNRIYYVLIFIVILITTNVFPKLFHDIFMIPVFLTWLIIFVILKVNSKRNKLERNLKEKIISVLLIMLFYYIIYFALGIFLGFGKNPRNLTFINIIKNLILYLGTRFFQENLRLSLVKANKTKTDFVIISLIFTFIELTYTEFIVSINTIEAILEYICSRIIPSIARSFLITYLSKFGGLYLNLSFSFLFYGIDLICPIIPKFDWFVISAKDLILCIVIYTVISNIQIVKTERVFKRDIKGNNIISFVPILIFLIIFVLFMIGVFEYKPIAVMSNSMYPYFSRGSVVIIKSFDENYPETLKKGDVIQYYVDGKFILHRINDIQIDYKGNYSIITKGDNNNANDVKPVSLQQICGIVKYKIPYIGYPSVWFNEYILNYKN